MSKSFSIDIYDGWQIDDDFKQLRVAEVHLRDEKGKRQRKTWIKIVGDDDVTLLDSMALWARKGCPSKDELTAVTP